MPGDVILLPTGTEHVLGSDAAAVARTSERVSDTWECTGSGTMRLGSGPTQTHILCAHYDHDPAISTQVVTLLPEVVHLRAENGGGCLDDTVRLLARELAHPQVATAVVLDRLVDILLVQLLRVWLASEPARAQPSWLGALGDATVGAAVAKLHAQPARAWTTAMLARGAGGLAGDAVAAVRRRPRRVARRLPDALADGPRRAPAARQRRQPRDDRGGRRLHVGLRLQPGLQPRALAAAREVPERRARLTGGDRQLGVTLRLG